MSALYPVRLENKPFPIQNVPIYLCVLKDNKLSWRARFLHSYLRTFETNYHFYALRLAKDLRWNQKTVDATLRELSVANLLDLSLQIAPIKKVVY